MFLNKELCQRTLSIILGENIELVDIATESKEDLKKAALNSVYFDVKTIVKDGRIITLDLQRKYNKKRVRNRTVYYACLEITSQKVQKGRYENLKSAVVTFLLTEAPLNSTSDNSTILLMNHKTGEEYSDLLSIVEVNIRHISDNDKEDIRILRDFFGIDNQDKWNTFKKNYTHTEYGNLLIKNYISATSDISLLNHLGEEEKFMYRLSEEERLEEHQEGIKEGIKEGLTKTAINMLNKGFRIYDIIEITGLTESEIKNLQLLQK